MNAQDIKTVKLVINSDQAQQKLDDINKKLETARQKRAEAFERGDAKALQTYTREVKNLERQAKRMQSRAQTVEKVLKNLDKATPKELKKTIKEINKELESGSVERGSEQWKTLTRALTEAKTELKKIKEETNAVKIGIDEWGNNWVGFSTIITYVNDAFSNALNAMQGYVEEFAEMDEHLANVTKYTGMSREEVEELNEAFKRMDTRTSRAALNDLAADAGRLGIQSKQQVLDFVDAANVLNVALGEDLGEGAVKNIGKLAQLFGDSERMGLKQAMLATGSTINELAQSSSANEGYIMDFTARLSGMARQAGMTQAQVMGLASVMDQSMVNAEEGSTALNRLIQELYTKPAQMAKAVGLDVKKFTTLVKQDANAALLEFASAAQKLGGMDALAPRMAELQLTGVGVTKVITSLANNLELVRNTQLQATEAFAQADSVQKEYDKANNTTQAQLEKSKQKLADLRTELGEKLMPVFTTATNGLTAFLQALMAVGTFAVQNIGAVSSLAFSIATYTAVAKAGTIAETAKNTAIALGTRIAATARAAGLMLTASYAKLTGNAVLLRAAQMKLNATMLANPYAAVLAAVVAVIGAVYLLASRTKELTREQRLQKEIQADSLELEKQGAEATAKTQNKIKLLTAIVHDNTRSLAERKKAIHALQQIAPQYQAEINEEGRITRENTKALTDYIEQLKKKAIAQAAIAKTDELTGQLLDLEMSRDRRRNAVSIRKKRLNDFIANNPELKHFAGMSAENILRQNTPGTFTPYGTSLQMPGKYQELHKLAVQLKEAEGWVDEQTQNIADVNKRIQTVNKKAHEMGATIETITNKTVIDEPVVNTSGDSGTAGTTTNHTNNTPSKADTLKNNAERDLLMAEVDYKIGLTTYAEYQKKKYDIELKLATDLRDLHQKNSTEWLKAEKQRLEVEADYKQEAHKQNLSTLEAAKTKEEAALKNQYIAGKISLENYEQQKTEITLKHLALRIEAERKQGADKKLLQELEQQYNELQNADKLQRQNEFWQKVQQLQAEHLKKSAEEQQHTEESIANEAFKRELLSEEEYQQAIQSIRDKYSKKQETGNTESELGGTMDAMSTSLVRTFEAFARLDERIRSGKASWQDWASVGVAALQTVSAVMSSVSQLYQAQQSAEEAKINAKYEAEIERAGKNSKKQKKLEEKKQAELAKVKSKYAKKQMVMELAQAVAQTAVAAINAYASASKVNWLLGPIAASMALAAGSIQIAAIKKQHEAQDQGYYEGGFTGGNHFRREAGVVHEGEFVANHQAVRNPAILPVLNLIDQAQRTNRVASLTAADVSRAITAPSISASAVTAADNKPTVTVVDTAQPRTAEALEKLTAQIDEGITAVVTIDGPNGFARQWKKYNKLVKL